MTHEIDVTALKSDEKAELANLLFKCGYRVALKKEKVGNKNRQFIVADKEV